MKDALFFGFAITVSVILTGGGISGLFFSETWPSYFIAGLMIFIGLLLASVALFPIIHKCCKRIGYKQLDEMNNKIQLEDV